MNAACSQEALAKNMSAQPFGEKIWFICLIITICWHKAAWPMIQIGRQKFIITQTSSEFKNLSFLTYHFIRYDCSAACSDKYLVSQPHSSNSVHWDMHTWARQPAEDHTVHQSEEERWLKWLWTWYGCRFTDPLIDVVHHTTNVFESFTIAKVPLKLNCNATGPDVFVENYFNT